MNLMPDFIQAYHDEIFDEEAGAELRKLAIEYKNERMAFEKSKNAQYTNGIMQKKLDGRVVKVDFNKIEADFENRYKARAMEVAQPHIEDPALFEEIVKKHGPLEVSQTVKQEKQAEKKQTIEQEKALDKPDEALSQEPQKEQEIEDEIEKLRVQFANNRERIQGRER